LKLVILIVVHDLHILEITKVLLKLSSSIA